MEVKTKVNKYSGPRITLLYNSMTTSPYGLGTGFLEIKTKDKVEILSLFTKMFARFFYREIEHSSLNNCQIYLLN